ncbi:hypothetical protein Daesc_000653 [Daldinia eschscholtzii]|uniref:Uncharacterized protein n=1 Tax=Daldinia eschscholtzii TaxID=292717 RepID=A0AAX6MZE2_9PEZI
MPHSTHEGEDRPDCMNGTKTDSGSAQGKPQQEGSSSQTTMLEIWANETERERLPFSEVIQQQAVQYAIFLLGLMLFIY